MPHCCITELRIDHFPVRSQLNYESAVFVLEIVAELRIVRLLNAADLSFIRLLKLKQKLKLRLLGATTGQGRQPLPTFPKISMEIDFTFSRNSGSTTVDGCETQKHNKAIAPLDVLHFDILQG